MRTITISTSRTDAHAVLDIFEHSGVRIARQYDSRGPLSDWFYYVVTIEVGGKDFDFNSVADARRWIDSELHTDRDFDAMREWGIGRARAC
jgi:hypothetical protein